METNLNNLYLFRALDAYPYELEKAVEALNYALSYDPENAKALHLMAKICDEQLNDFNAAKDFYERALASRMDIPDLYPDYIRFLINNDAPEEAQRLIDFAKSVRGIDKAGIAIVQAQLFESLNQFSEAEKAVKEAKQLALNEGFISFADTMLSRLKRKRKVQENEKRVQEHQSKKEEEANKTNWFQNRLNSLL
ncbi:hypothetical protein [Psychroserpens sp.]|uniref:hypothetical protein n=1 Tax=Psychroserpens sp. TaxID=2020870 RepID=UPI001B141158|nr:hypothetical protein [Psychroserpens sp.]MBO6605271.1 hypothetical protein [Psychroserpens sp.]MBO6631272.1 hypothetical protein [Psychroserpens sp.]MBO6653920.1 hypothetical protein [Psychroserpens sp.]MBO6682241.1 hypothetical protein [Psychroserpens sp.]MBO6748645.1 hypothetical protein [Psychroserpens sp.]